LAELLLHSLKEFDEVIFELTERLEPRSILEIGAETGVFSERLLAYCEKVGGRLVTIDPLPSQPLLELATPSTTLELVVGYSIPHLREFGTDASLVLVDGDHNYFTVSNELELIARAWQAQAIDGLMLLHDVGFPCARRDFYYEPRNIPAEARHPYSYELGVTYDNESLVRGGFRGEGAFAWALAEGGPKNGVRTAIEDFVKAHPDYEFRSIDAVFGLGALTRRGTTAGAVVAEVFARYDNALVRRLERNRFELYLKVLELQDLLSAQAAPPPAVAAEASAARVSS
jgi:hypothetical protein